MYITAIIAMVTGVRVKSGHATQQVQQMFGQCRGIRVFCVSIVLLFPAQAACVQPVSELAAQAGYWSIQYENDMFASSDDQYYTSGIEFSFLSAGDAPRWLSTLANQVPLYRETGQSAVAYLVGQKMFTPEDTDREELIEDDRPYAGWLYASAVRASRVELDERSEFVNGVAVKVGVVGPSAYAKQAQRGVHGLIGIEKPEGWENQLNDELGVALTYARKWRYFARTQTPVEYEISPHAVMTLGNVYTYAGGGIVFRWGTKLRNDLGPPSISPGFPGLSYFRPSKLSNWYLFAGVEGRAVARNIFLDGNTFKNSHSVDKRPLVGEAQFGLAFHFDNVRVALSHIIRSREFDKQNDVTSFGALNVSFHL